MKKQALIWKASVSGVLVATMLVAGVVSSAAKEDVAPVAVYLAEPTAEFQDAALKDRRDSWNDMRFAFSKKLVRLVASREEATLVVEVLGRRTGTASGSKVSVNPLGTVTNQQFGAKAVAVKLTFGEYSTEIIGKTEENEYSIGGAQWKHAAFDAVRGIEKWVKTNRAKLP